MIYYCNTYGRLKKPYWIRILSFGFFRSLRFFKKNTIGLLLFTIPFYICTNLPILIVGFLHTDFETIINFRKEMIIKLFILLFLTLISCITLPRIFTIHYCVGNQMSFTKALRHSKRLYQANRSNTIRTFLKYNIVLTLAFLVSYYLILLVTAVTICLFADKSLAISVFLSAYPKINLYTTLFSSMIAFIINMNLVTSLFATYKEGKYQDLLQDKILYAQPIHFRSGSHKNLVNALLLLVLVIGAANFFFTIRNDSLGLSNSLSPIQITSHRGNSSAAPENTMPSLENAISAGSDYAEIDVQQTKEGEIILLHDYSLLRTAGVNQYIWDLTDVEISSLDVGSWFGIEFLDTKIPTLAEVLEYCKGKIKLNIEIKAKGKPDDFEENLVDLIKKYDYEDQCLISCTSYTTLVKMKELDPSIKTGLILSSAYGNFYDRDAADFFSIRSRFITQSLVESVHHVGKEVHAWTVNTSREMERMKALDVDNIITNNPTRAREILFRDATNDSFLQLMSRMVKNRSLYRFTQVLN